MQTVNLHIAADQNTTAAASPVCVKPIEFRAWTRSQISQAFSHRRLGHTIGNLLAVGEGELVVENVGGHDVGDQ